MNERYRLIADILSFIKPEHINKDRLIHYFKMYGSVDLSVIDMLYNNGIISKEEYRDLIKSIIDKKDYWIKDDKKRLELIDKDFEEYTALYLV